MKVLIVGSNGQLGCELQRTCPSGIEISAKDYPDIDITKNKSFRLVIDKEAPDWIINSAAYTNVDGAEEEPGEAHAVNCEGAKNLAREALRVNARLVHISTDFVFNGNNCRPYKPLDPPDPQSVYGKTKLDGELAVLNILKEDALIIRTAWLYSVHGNNFVYTMLRLMKEKEEITVIDDQIGTPTWANGLAKAIWATMEKGLKGIFHWTDAGVASWYDFAVAIQDEAIDAGILSKRISIQPIPTEKYLTQAKRPSFSVLDKRNLLDATGLLSVHWRIQLRHMIREFTH
jgi:dTDP-4-dehydrorhamnose reductase